MATISPAHNEARLNATRAHIDGGFVEVLSSALVVLARIPLGNPCGVVAGGVLTLVPTAEVLAANSGVADSARIVTPGADVAVAGLSVSDAAGAGNLKLTTLSIYVGGSVSLTTGVLA